NIAWESFPAWGATEEERQLTIGARVMREIVVHDQHVAPRFHEVLGDAGPSVGSDVGEPRRVVTLGHDHDGVVHRAFLSEDGHGLCHGGSSLADRAVHADDILSSLVEDRVDRNSRLARLPVAQNQLALAAAYRNECV